MIGRYVAGAFLVLLGIGLALDATGQIDFLGTYWPLAVVGLGIAVLANNPRRPVGGFVLILGGFVLQLAKLGILPEYSARLLGPALLIALGLALLSSRRRWLGRRHRHDPVAGPVNDRDLIDMRAAFSGVNEKVRIAAFRGGNVEAVCGGVRLDLRESRLAPEGADLELNATLGGIEVFFPADWNVQVEPHPMFGGVENRTTPSPGPALKVRAFATLGGVTLRN